MASRWRPRLLLSAVLAIFACDVETDDSSTLEIAVRVEPPIQASTSFPAEILVGFDSSGSGFLVFRVGFLCSPDAPFSTTATLSPAPRDGGAAVEAWLVPIDRGSAFACGPLATPQPVPTRRAPDGAPRTSARAEVLAGCGTGDVRSATLVIGASSSG